MHLESGNVAPSGKGRLKSALWHLGEGKRVVMHAFSEQLGTIMAHEEDPILTNPLTPEVARHVHDYSRFTTMLKWGAATALIIALIMVFIIL